MGRYQTQIPSQGFQLRRNESLCLEIFSIDRPELSSGVGGAHDYIAPFPCWNLRFKGSIDEYYHIPDDLD